jgi:hypothetical protein
MRLTRSTRRSATSASRRSRPQRWGIVGVATARHFKVFFKGGWREGIEHQVALLERFGRRIALAVLTSGESAADGRSTEAGIASRVLAD